MTRFQLNIPLFAGLADGWKTNRRGFNRTFHYLQGWQMVGKQIDEVSIEQSIIFRAGRWLENK